jgi:hypothetical protein
MVKRRAAKSNMTLEMKNSQTLSMWIKVYISMYNSRYAMAISNMKHSKATSLIQAIVVGCDGELVVLIRPQCNI